MHFDPFTPQSAAQAGSDFMSPGRIEGEPPILGIEGPPPPYSPGFYGEGYEMYDNQGWGPGTPEVVEGVEHGGGGYPDSTWTIPMSLPLPPSLQTQYPVMQTQDAHPHGQVAPYGSPPPPPYRGGGIPPIAIPHDSPMQVDETLADGEGGMESGGPDPLRECYQWVGECIQAMEGRWAAHLPFLESRHQNDSQTLESLRRGVQTLHDWGNATNGWKENVDQILDLLRHEQQTGQPVLNGLREVNGLRGEVRTCRHCPVLSRPASSHKTPKCCRGISS